MKKKILIILLIILSIIILTLTFVFFEDISNFVYEKKYDNIEKFEKELTYNTKTNSIDDNLISINDLNITLSNLEYTENNNLNFILKFSNSKNLNSVGYTLRIYNDEYYLGDRIFGYASLSNRERIMYSNIFYKKIFDNSDNSIFEKNLLNSSQFVNLPEVLDDGTLLHNISFTIPENFIIKDVFNIVLFDINYQNIGDKNFYKMSNPLLELHYKIKLGN